MHINPNGSGLDDTDIASLFPGEVVTRAFVRDVQLPAGGHDGAHHPGQRA